MEREPLEADLDVAARVRGALDALLEDKKKLAAVQTYHAVAGSAKLTSAKTVNGQTIAIKPTGKTLAINDAKVTSADIAASNGVIHVIDTVLLPK